ncbi:hypothetical protein LCGC14_2842670 [marine sediment metagenome]|uniref:Uncharacterized protein n=1 Tax=marine sediment metagenome TaxID=412755 RepID=A0A0F8YAT1_9ZZZZ
MLEIRNVKMIDVSDWSKLVSETYARPYNFQQQDGCKSRGMFNITIPSDCSEDKDMPDSVPEEINGEEMGVNFKAWLKRDPKEWKGANRDERSFDLYWDRNFYPTIHMVANDLHKKGLIDAGDYVIDIDW